MPIEMDEEEDESTTRCKTCDRELDQGVDVTILHRGVLGPRGFVPLEEMEFFCSWKCLEEYCCDRADESLDARDS